MFKTRTVIACAALLGATMLSTAPAYAQATRTWVSGVGDDVNPCSRTAPCKTFAGAISKTAAGGEINCLDPAGYGAVTINKSLVIDCHYTEGGALAGGNGIVVNAGATDVVVIRGLDIFGVNPPTHGVRIIAGGAVHIEDCVIRRFNSASSFGVSFQPAGATQLFINNSTITQNGNGATGGGILIQPTGVSGSARVVITNSHVLDNANSGLRIDSTGNTSTAGISVDLRNSEFSGNGSGIAAVAVGTNPMTIMLTDSSVSNNGGGAIIGNGTGVTMRVGNTTITGNVSGVTAAGSSSIATYGNNRLINNPIVGAINNGTFSSAIPTQ
jgi:hypothetical protein